MTIQNFAFDQPALTVKKGDSVTWTNQDAAPHTVVSDQPAFSSDTLGQKDSYKFTFDSKGTFEYHCGIHPSMKARIVVE